MMVRPLAVMSALAFVAGGGRYVAAQRTTGDTTAHASAAADSAVRADTGAPVLSAAADQARGVDAEMRAALFELASDRPLAALARLDWLRTSADSTRPELVFLIAEAYYRLGMGAQFRAEAAQLAAVPGGVKYQSTVNAQLMLEAFRRGDDPTVRTLASSSPGGDRGLASFVSGLSAYRAGDWTAARSAFAAARAAGGVYAPYAQYMDALSAMGGDTTRGAAALDALRPLTNVATGAFGDQVRLTAAELAFEEGQYEAAAGFAARVAPTSSVGAQALLTRAWSLYRAGQADSARAAFTAFANSYPNLPERDQARIMLGQVMLDAGHTEDAEHYFDAMADSVGNDLAATEGRSSAALGEAAKALVQARAAGLMFLDDPRSGKTLALADDADADAATMLATFDGADAPPARTAPEVVSIAQVDARLDSLAPALGADFPRRLVYTPASSPAALASYTDRAQALSSADAAVTLARFRLQEQLDVQVMRIAALEDLQHLTAATRASLATEEQQLASLQDSLTRVGASLDRSRSRVRQMLASQVAATQTAAAENVRMVDSLRTALGTSVTPADAHVLDVEANTASIYQTMADSVAHQIDGIVARQPVFAMHDSIMGRLARARALHDTTVRVLATDDSVVARELASLRGVESDQVHAMRAALAAAVAARAAAETQMIALVDGELRARAASQLAALQHDKEAADYGSASASFFRAMELGGGTGTPAAPSAPTSSATHSPR
jgi:tetratricopeptide (TPR) repeat protein